jgi:hypothetical protein
MTCVIGGFLSSTPKVSQLANSLGAGHARASMSLDVYSHVLVEDDDEWS